MQRFATYCNTFQRSTPVVVGWGVRAFQARSSRTESARSTLGKRSEASVQPSLFQVFRFYITILPIKCRKPDRITFSYLHTCKHLSCISIPRCIDVGRAMDAVIVVIPEV